MKKISRPLAGGGHLVIEPGGRMYISIQPFQSLAVQITDVSWFDQARASKFIAESCLPAEHEVEEQWAQAIARRRVSPWVTLLIRSTCDSHQLARRVGDLLASANPLQRASVVTEAAGRVIRDGELVVQVAQPSGASTEISVCLPTPEDDPVLAVIGALGALDMDAEFVVKRPDGQEEEASFRDWISLTGVLQLLGICWPLPPSKNWSGVTRLLDVRVVQFSEHATTINF